MSLCSVQMSTSTLSVDGVKHVLTYIPADDRETWVSVGMSLKHEYGDTAFQWFDEWSQSAPEKYKVQSVRDVWRSFKGSGKSMGTLIYLARQYGWNGSGYRSGPRIEKRVDSPPETPSQTSRYAKELFLAANDDDQFVMGHPYSISKGLESSGGVGRGTASGRLIGKKVDCLIVPIRNIVTGQVQGVECINAEGVKQTFGQKSGGALILGNSLQQREPWYILEGWASAYSTVFHHDKQTAVCAFGKGSQDGVAHEINQVYRPSEVIILREVDA